MPGMPMPEWYDEAKEQLGETDKEPMNMTFQPVEFVRVENFPHLFAEYDIRESDVLVHLFPRGGIDDQWTNGHYINRCHNCKSEVPMPSKPSELKPCPKCGHTGLIYVPGRVEEKADVAFPANAQDMIKEAVDEVWMGGVAIDEVPELGAFALQLQSAKNTAGVVGTAEFVGKICSAFDRLLAEKH